MQKEENLKKLKMEKRGDKMKTNKGITLIALVITIIVMLILVVVTIRISTNGGLFDYAGKAARETKDAIADEKDIADGKITIGGVTYNSIEEYLETKGIIKETHNWARTGDTVSCIHCQTTLTIGQEVNYTARGKADENITWVVLGIEDINKNGTNETLLLTTLAPTTNTITLGNEWAYNNGPEEINRMCKELYGTEARGMTIEDVNNCLGYTPAGGIYYDGSTYQTTNNFTTKLNELGSVWESIKTEGTNTPDGVDTEEALGNYELNGYFYNVSEDGTYLVDPADRENISHTITERTRNIVFGATNNYNYWLASRGVYVTANRADFGPGCVDLGIVRSYSYCYDSGIPKSHGGRLERYKPEYSLRPVVSIRSNIPTAVVENPADILIKDEIIDSIQN